ncbi:MAG: hypothetical protein JW751_03260 [Polyangiaceae bacterium]|nr:hypothetical protein [Polyangiaceae bacterium]
MLSGIDPGVLAAKPPEATRRAAGASRCDEIAGGVQLVPIERVRTHYARLRPGVARGGEQLGPEFPLLVALLPDGDYEVLDGLKRLARWRERGYRVVPVVVDGAGSSAEHKRRLLAANAPARTSTALDEARVVCSLRDEEQLGPSAIGRLLGHKRQWVERRMALGRGLSRRGTDFESWDDLDARRRVWLDETPGVGNRRVHGTTRRVVNEAWREEQPFLIQLPDQRFAVHEDGVRVVDADSTLSMNGTRYTVPSVLANRSVAVHIYAEHFEVLDPQGHVAFSRAYVSDEEKGKLQIDQTHYASVPRRPHVPGGERLDEALVRRFPELASLVQGLRLRFKSLAPIHYGALIRLSERYGEPAFREAALRAQQYRRFDTGAVERILVHDHPLPDHDELGFLEVEVPLPIRGNRRGYRRPFGRSRHHPPLHRQEHARPAPHHGRPARRLNRSPRRSLPLSPRCGPHPYPRGPR